MDNVKIVSTTASAAEAIYKKLHRMQYTAQRPLLVALSGGSTPKSIFSYWTENYSTSSLWHQVIFFWVDERCVLPTDPESNYGEMQRLFFDHVDVPYGHIHRMCGEVPANDALKHYTDILDKYVPKHNNLPQFDLVWLGMGTDGHTASIFPGSENLLTASEWCALAQHPESGQKRLTLTGPVIANAKNVMVVATGADKAAIVSQVLEQKGNWKQYPISHVVPVKGKRCWLLDEKAALSLESSPQCCMCE